MSKSKEQIAEELAAAEAKITEANAAAEAAEAACDARITEANAAAEAAETAGAQRIADANTAADEAEAAAKERVALAEQEGYQPAPAAASAVIANAVVDTFDYAANPDNSKYSLVAGKIISGYLDHPFEGFVFQEGKPQTCSPSKDAWLRMQIEKGYVGLFE